MGLQGKRIRFIVRFIATQGVDASRQFVGQSECRLVEATSVVQQSHSPVFELSEAVTTLPTAHHGSQGRSCAVNEQAPDVTVAAFRNGAESSLLPAAVFAGCQTEEAGELPGTREASQVTDAGDQRRTGNGPNPGNSGDALRFAITLLVRREPTVDIVNAPIQLLNAAQNPIEHRAEEVRQWLLGVFQDARQLADAPSAFPGEA